jgi:hypothetical protein
MKKYNTSNPPIQVAIEHRHGCTGTHINSLGALLEYGNQNDKDQVNEVILTQIEELRRCLFL